MGDQRKPPRNSQGLEIGFPDGETHSPSELAVQIMGETPYSPVEFFQIMQGTVIGFDRLRGMATIATLQVVGAKGLAGEPIAVLSHQGLWSSVLITGLNLPHIEAAPYSAVEFNEIIGAQDLAGVEDGRIQATIKFLFEMLTMMIDGPDDDGALPDFSDLTREWMGVMAVSAEIGALSLREQRKVDKAILRSRSSRRTRRQHSPPLN